MSWRRQQDPISFFTQAAWDQASLSLYKQFLRRHGIDKVAGGAWCPRRVAGRRCLDDDCVCGAPYKADWIDHDALFSRDGKPVVFVSQPYYAPPYHDPTDAANWTGIVRKLRALGLEVQVLDSSQSWYFPGRTKLIEVIAWRPAVVQLGELVDPAPS